MIEIALFVVILCASCTSGGSPRSIKFERGSKGIVDCPDMVDNGYLADDTEAIYWSFSPKGSSDSPRSIISYFHGVTTQNSDLEQYKIQNGALVISNVAQSDEGTYFYRYIPWVNGQLDGSVEVSEKVSSKTKVKGCSEDQPSCNIDVPFDTINMLLTCSVEHAKPAVNISWFRWSSKSNEWTEILAKHQFEPATCNTSKTDCFYVSGTFNSYATVQISLESNSPTFMCKTNNTMIEHLNVTVITTGSDIVTEVTNPTRLSSCEPTSLTTSEPLGSSECHSNWTYVSAGQFCLNVLLVAILVKNQLRNTKKSK